MARMQSSAALNGGLLAATAMLTLAGLAPRGAWAGSITAESIWDQRNALQRAQEQVPVGATVTGHRCTEVNVRTGNYRYICTLEYTLAPTPTAPLTP